jgi:histidinol dehydrogenase
MKILNNLEAAKAALTRSPSAFGDNRQEEIVRDIIAQVRKRGDVAAKRFTKEIDGADIDSLEISKDDINNAYSEVDAELVDALNIAAEQVSTFHQMQFLYSVKEFMEEGVGQLIRPVEKVGIYVPGGTACYPSTVLMTTIPAQVAGVNEIIMTTPPGEGAKVPPITLVAADIAGVDRIFRIGGAQAIAALAYGTESVPKVDKICGPGNIFVTLAKKLLYGVVDIDGLYGPTETVIVADDSASPEICAADLLAQAEHDVLSSAIMITTSQHMAQEVVKEIEYQLKDLEKADIAHSSLEQRGCIIVVDDMEQAIELVNLYAPEHLSLMVRDASSHIDSMRNTGCIFIGESSPETLGDYAAGPSHVMPTGGSARFSSPLNVNDFLKLTTVVALSDEDARMLGPVAAAIARAEGLTAHARAAELRLKKEKE